mgnify:CR=1 FL=1
MTRDSQFTISQQDGGTIHIHVGDATANEPVKQQDTSTFYETTLRLSEIQKSILRQEPGIWEDNSAFHNLLKDTVFIVVGTWGGCELFDRTIAYRMAQELDDRGTKAMVITDCYWLSVKDQPGYADTPVIAVGGPGVNALSAGIAQEIRQHSNAIGMIEHERRLTGFVWGGSAGKTLNAGKMFIDSYLDDFLQKRT